MIELMRQAKDRKSTEKVTTDDEVRTFQVGSRRINLHFLSKVQEATGTGGLARHLLLTAEVRPSYADLHV